MKEYRPDEKVRTVEEKIKYIPTWRKIGAAFGSVSLLLFIIMGGILYGSISKYNELEKQNEGAVFVEGTVVETHRYGDGYESNAPILFQRAYDITKRSVFTNVVEFTDLNGGLHRVELFALINSMSNGENKDNGSDDTIYLHRYKVGSKFQIGYQPDDIEGSAFQLVTWGDVNGSVAFSLFILAILALVMLAFGIIVGIVIVRQTMREPVITMRQLTVTHYVTDIPERIFADCTNLEVVKISSTVKSIGEGAIPKTAKIICKAGSYAEQWAKMNGYNVEIEK